MQLFENLTSLLKNTMFFNSYVKYWPEPLNDASFDVFILILFVGLVVIPELYYALQTRVVRFQIKKKNREYAQIAASGKRNAEVDEEKNLIEQYLKFLLVAHCIDKDIDISFEEWKEVRYGDGSLENGEAQVNEKEESVSGDAFGKMKEAAGSIQKKVADINMFGLINGKKNRKAVTEKVAVIEEVKKHVEESSKEVKAEPIEFKGRQKPENENLSSEDGLDEFERILNSIKLKQDEKKRISKRTRQDSAIEMKRRRSLEDCLALREEEPKGKTISGETDKRIYDAKEVAVRLKEKEMQRKKRQEERLLRKETENVDLQGEAVCSCK